MRLFSASGTCSLRSTALIQWSGCVVFTRITFLCFVWPLTPQNQQGPFYSRQLETLEVVVMWRRPSVHQEDVKHSDWQPCCSHVTEIHFLLFRWMCTFSIVLTGWLSDTSCLLAAAPFFCFFFFLSFFNSMLFTIQPCWEQFCLRNLSFFRTGFLSVIPIELAERESNSLICQVVWPQAHCVLFTRS